MTRHLVAVPRPLPLLLATVAAAVGALPWDFFVKWLLDAEPPKEHAFATPR